ncbi:MAG: site-specific integrase, partial [Bacteroidota bacterium]
HLKTFINKAVEAGVIEKNPLSRVKVKTAKGNRVYLSKDEFKKLVTKYEKLPHGKVKNALRVFLFACYTGLRYTDIKLLTWGKLKESNIELQFHKTAKFDTIPLNQKAIELLPVPGEKKVPVFRVPSNQKLNEYLKSGITMAGIDKTISFHCARHTFATLLLEATGNIAVVSKLLGHSNISTTQIYAKVLESEKEKAVLLMDAF